MFTSDTTVVVHVRASFECGLLNVVSPGLRLVDVKMGVDLLYDRLSVAADVVLARNIREKCVKHVGAKDFNKTGFCSPLGWMYNRALKSRNWVSIIHQFNVHFW